MIVGGDARERARRWRRELSGARDALGRRSPRLQRRGRASACSGDDPAAMRFLDAFAGALPADAVVLSDMCIPGYWLGGFHRRAPRRGG